MIILSRELMCRCTEHQLLKVLSIEMDLAKIRLIKVLSIEMDLAKIRLILKAVIKERVAEVFGKIRLPPIL